MKVVISQVNVGSKFRFMPSGVSSSLSNYPRDGWLTEAAARKCAKANGHEIVKVEKVAGNGEKIHRIEYTYKDRFGKTKKQTSELVGKDVEPLKKRIVEGLTRNGDTLVSFGKITTKDSVDFDDEPSMLSRVAEKYAMDAIFPTSKGFANEKGLLKRDTRKGLKPYEVTFVVKGKDGRPFNTKRSKMAASIEEAKKWAQSESKKYNGVTKIDVKEFKDSCEDIENIREKYANDASLSQKKDQPVKVTNISIKPSPVGGFEGNVYYSKNGETDLYSPWHIMANGKWGFPFGRSSTRLTQSDKKLIEQKIKKLVSQKGVKVKDSADDFASDASVATFTVKSNRNGSKYGYIEKICKTEAEAKALVDKLKKDGFVAMYRKVMYRDSSDTMDRIRAKYCMDVAGAGVVNPNFKFQTNVEKRLATTRRGSGRVMTLPQYGKPSKVTVKKDGNSFSVIGKDGQKLNKSPFRSYEEAEKWARGNGWMVERR